MALTERVDSLGRRYSAFKARRKQTKPARRQENLWREDIHHISGDDRVWPPGPVVVAGCRDEILRIPYFLEYYRSIGCVGFIIIDNASGDGSSQFLAKQHDVLLYGARGSFARAQDGLAWVNGALRRHAVDRWLIKADIDELLTHALIESDGIVALCDEVTRLGERSVFTPLIDMYPQVPLDEVDYRKGEPFLDTAPCFDGPESYWIKVRKTSLDLRGGPRARLFSWSPLYPGPLLSKCSMVRWGVDDSFQSPHQLADPGLNRPTTVAPILHFKFFQDFHQRCLQAVEENEHWKGAIDYRTYLKGLKEHGRGMSFVGDVTRLYVNASSTDPISTAIRRHGARPRQLDWRSLLGSRYGYFRLSHRVFES